jgi:transcriptional regulator
MAASTSLLPGTLDLLILKALSLQPLHGLGVSRRIEQISRGEYRVGPGSLFPALHRLEQKGWLAASEGESENRRRAKFYRLTRAGERQLREETEQWKRVVGVMEVALEWS